MISTQRVNDNSFNVVVFLPVTDLGSVWIAEFEVSSKSSFLSSARLLASCLPFPFVGLGENKFFGGGICTLYIRAYVASAGC